MKLPRSTILGVALLLAVWCLAAFWVAPEIITRAYRGESLDVLNRAIVALGERPLEAFLRFWRRVAIALTALGVFLIWARVGAPASRTRRLVASEDGLSPRSTLGLALWFGVVAGVAEGVHLTLWFLLERHPSREFDWEFAWMAAPSAALAFLVLAVGLLLLARAVPNAGAGPSRPALPLLVLLFGTIVLYGILEVDRWRLAPVAAVLLSVGAASILARRASRNPDRVLGLVRKTRLPLATVVAISICVGVWQLPSVREGRALGALTSAETGSPNIILIILDTVRAKSLSLYGYERSTTPRLEQWARRGVVFERAFSTAPWTLPSHASLFTGRWTHEHTADYGQVLDRTHATLAEELAKLGYHTAGFTANRPNTAAATGLARGFARYEDYEITPASFLVKSFLGRMFVRLIPLDKSTWRFGTGRKTATQNTDDVLRWLDGRRRRPFFLFVNYFDAHDPYVSPRRYRDRFPPPIPPVLTRVRDVTEGDLEGTRALYDAAISYVDEEVDRLLRSLEARGDLENAIVVVSSDHGEAMGEHGLQFHGNHLYLPITRVPLVLLAEGRAPAGLRVETPVSLRDVPATLMEMSVAGETSFAGQSLTRFWRGHRDASTSGPLFAELSPSWQTPWTEGVLRSVIEDRHQFLLYPDGRRELYDIFADPGQEDDLATLPTSRAPLEDLEARLDSALASR